MQSTHEEWRAIPGFEGHYEVSNCGRVRSLDRFSVTGRRLKGRVMKTRSGLGGHLSLNLCKDGKATSAYVHRLVLTAFVGECPEGMECCHNNGDPTDNRLENLRWDTQQSNVDDRGRHGKWTAAMIRTHCKRGHEFIPENTVPPYSKRHGRSCKACAVTHRHVARNPHLKLEFKELADGYYSKYVEMNRQAA